MLDYISPWPNANNIPNFPRKLCILGATGSIGDSALAVVLQYPELFKVHSLSAGYNIEKLAQLANTFRPKRLAIADEKQIGQLKSLLDATYQPDIVSGLSGVCSLADDSSCDTVLSAIVGAAGFLPTLTAAKAGKFIALANKESLVLGGDMIRHACKQNNAVILPVDSEHNALFQGLIGHREKGEVEKLILTASGGAFRDKDKKFLETATAAQALKHPNWNMGAKITIDSASLMNKGLEIIEACHLYGVDIEDIDVVIHPQSIIHSLVEYCDGSQIAHLALPSMHIPLAYSLSYPKRMPLKLEKLKLTTLSTLTFQEPNEELFPCLRLAKEAFKQGTNACIVLNAVNEIMVDAFIHGKCSFLAIPRVIEENLSQLENIQLDSADDILAYDEYLRKKTLKEHFSL